MSNCKKKYIVFLFLFTVLQANKSPKIGLVLSGGGSKGFAHIATLKALDSLNIPIDYIAGTSFGAIVGAMYALGYPGKQIEKMALATDWYEVQNDEPKRKHLPYFRKKDTGKYQLQFGLDKVKPVTPTGLIYGQKIILDLSKWTREYEQVYDFDKLPIPFRCNAFDIMSGKEVILKEGSLSHALRASLSIPTIFAPVEWGDGLLVDGGVINNLPVDIVKEMGADIILAVDVSATSKNKSQLKNIYDVVDQTIGVHGYEKTKASIRQADYYIRPNLETVSFTDYSLSTIEYLFDRGEKAVKDNWHIFLKLQEMTINREQRTKNLKPLIKPLINQVIIKGNKLLSKKFIRSFIGLEKGMKLNPQTLDENIAELYSLGYFRIIYYEIHTSDNEKIDLVINVQESQLKKFNLGLRWDNYYDLIAIVNVQLNSSLFPGLRIEDQFQFAGLQKNIFSIYYPSRKLNFPIYPFLRITNTGYIFKKYDLEVTPKRYKHRTNGVSTGIGVLLKNFWNTELEYFYRQESFLPEEYDVYTNKIYASISLSAQLDLLDDVLLPSNGILFKGKYENSSTEWGSTQSYHLYRGLGDIYFSRKRNTYHIMGYYHQILNDFPQYITAIPEGSQTFAGVEEFQLWGSTLVFFRGEYRYKYKKDIFAHLVVNWLISAKADDNIATENKWGTGFGITLMSPLGPLEFIWSRGPKNIYLSNKGWQNLFYFSAGYKF